ncbi:hypothetical protein [Lacticaseibacillus saniviri]
MKSWQSYLLTVALYLSISFVLSLVLHREFKWWIDIVVPTGAFIGSYLVIRRQHRHKYKH